METRRRLRRSVAKSGRGLNRTPLSDLSNAPSFASPSFAKHKRKPPAPHFPPNDAISAGSFSGIGATASLNPGVLEISTGDHGDRKISSDLERSAATRVNSNCSQVESFGSVNIDEGNMDGPDVLPQMLRVPSQKQKKKKLHHKSEAKETTDYIKKQRAYFAEIDAFELSEEIVSENDLE